MREGFGNGAEMKNIFLTTYENKKGAFAPFTMVMVNALCLVLLNRTGSGNIGNNGRITPI